jgi:hypothetical protein
MLTLWWLALHGLLAAAAVALDLSILQRAVVVAGLGAHAALRLPRSVVATVICRPDGRWALPDAALQDLRLGLASRHTAHWVRLVLLAEGCRAFDILLLRDQLRPAEWRALRARLAAGPPPAADDLR